MVRRSTYQLVALGSGVSLLAISGVAELAGWGESGFGALQRLLLIVGTGLLAVGALPNDGPIASVVRQLILLFGAAYFSLLLVEAGLLVVTPYRERIHPVVTLRGSLVSTPWGFGLKPGWTGLFQDGVVTAAIEVNSRGDRDDEPGRAGGDTRVLLLGDSVAFGYALGQHERIDVALESLSKGRIDAYNLGVPGYGPGETAAKLQSYSSHGPRAEHVIYVFNGNDLRDDARPGSYKVWDGYLVPSVRPDGTPYTEAEYRQHEEAKADDTTLRNVLSLIGVRNLIARLVEPDHTRVMGPLDSYQPEGIDRALAHTIEMKERAEAEGAKFTVVVVPMKGEAAPEDYAGPTRTFLHRLADASISYLDLHERLTVAEHYFDHDPHLNSAGARETAEAILELLEK